MSLSTLKGLYLITDDLLTPRSTLLEQVTQALEGGAKIVQLRDKKSTLEEIEQMAVKLQKLTQKYGALFVLNDKVDLAIKHSFSGLHIGKSDHHRVSEIRKNYSGVLGVSCYGDIALAKQMQDKGVDYVAFGSFFHSATKPDSCIIDLNILSKAKEVLDIPVCAIGGLNAQNISKVMKHKPDMISLINDIYTSDDIRKKSQFFADLY